MAVGSCCSGCSLIADSVPTCSGRAVPPLPSARAGAFTSIRPIPVLCLRSRAKRRLHGVALAVTDPTRGPDTKTVAANRLHSLLNGSGSDGEQEVLENILLAEPPESKVLLALASGGVVTLGALALCAFVHVDPAGGASLSLDSIKAACLGALAAIPLALFKQATWSDAARRMFPPLVESQQFKMEELRPLLANMSPTQAAVVLLAEVIPNLVMILPAAQGALAVSFNVYADYLRELGVIVPEMAPAALALVTTALLCGGARWLQFGPDSKQYEIVQTAIDNADRYYRIMGPSIGGDTPGEQSRAFKAVAASWLAKQEVATTFTAMTTATEVLFLGILFQETGDFAAPVVAGLLGSAVEFICIRNRLQQKDGGNGGLPL